jgi:predicted HTH transcriptional regulator
LGAEENAEKSLKVSGLMDPDGYIKMFWDAVNNPQKASINILGDKNVYKMDINGKSVVIIEVPRASRQDRPVHINGNINTGTYRRNGEGDYRCTKSEIKNMIRDSGDVTQDRLVLDNIPLGALDQGTINGYRTVFSNLKPNHVWEKIPTEEFLLKINAVDWSDEDGKLHPTAAGLLLFGKDSEIVKEFPNYFLDYREGFGEDFEERWRDRVTSGTGDWSGNLFDFYYRVKDRLTSDLKVPFVLLNGQRIDDTRMHKALREALANSLIHSDYYERRGVVVDKKRNEIVISNPGALRIPKDEALSGGISDPRNGALFQMFSMIGIGERAGSGLMNIESTWKDEKLLRPTLTENLNPDRTILTLPLGKKKDSEYIGTELNDIQKRVIEHLKNGPMSRAELKENISYPFTMREFAKSVLTPLMEAGIIEHTIPDKPTSMKQQYCLTTGYN